MADKFMPSMEFVRALASGNGNLPPRRQAAGSVRADISIYGQESSYTTWRLARMNLAIRVIDGKIADGDTFDNDRFPDLKVDLPEAHSRRIMTKCRAEGLSVGGTLMGRKNKTETKRPIESYEHRDKQRMNNPPVGLVTPDTDPDSNAKKTYAYDLMYRRKPDGQQQQTP